jgi:ATP-dependent RNA helicase DeaD
MDFENLNLKKELLNQLLKVGYTQATDIQINLIPKINEGLDVIGQAPTGTGKTLAFIIPILQNVKNEKKIQSLIIAPTRELVNQINDEIKKINYNPQTIFSYSIYGGIEINKQINFIKKYSPTIIVSTPGRLLDLLKRGIISVESINNITLDEVDVMLQMGFEKDLQRIFDFIKNKTQVIFISATIPTEIKKISSKYQNNPFFFKVESVEENQPQIKQYYTVVRNSQKLSALKAILEKNQFFLAIVFCNMKYLTKEIAAFLNENNFKAEAFQGNLKQNKREQLIKSFRKGDVNVLVATDIVARGIDIKNVDIVVNYDLPDDLNNYVHRIGRSGRNKTVGTSFIMVSMNQK